ncbi:MAG: hypothetical protein AB1466_00510 [Actinomycetota bacterium]
MAKEVKEFVSAAIKGAHAIIEEARENLKRAIDIKGSNHPVAFPNTDYYLPLIHGLTGTKVEKLSDVEQVLRQVRKLPSKVPRQKLWLPYLGNALDAGMAALFAGEIIEALRYAVDPNPANDIWLGAPGDAIVRKHGRRFVDGSASGFALLIGVAPEAEMAAKLVREMCANGLYVFMAGDDNGKTLAEQLIERGIRLGWDASLVPLGKEIHGHVHSLGFVTRVAMIFGGINPGDYGKILHYIRDRIFGFVLLLRKIDNEACAFSAGATNFGFSTIAEEYVPQLLPIHHYRSFIPR